jgi:hypothetical protein
MVDVAGRRMTAEIEEHLEAFAKDADAGARVRIQQEPVGASGVAR